MTPTSVFALGRMRHLDLLAHWYQAHPEASRPDHGGHLVPRISKEHLVTMILAARRSP